MITRDEDFFRYMKRAPSVGHPRLSNADHSIVDPRELLQPMQAHRRDSRDKKMTRSM
jgi:hypothetical protein